MAFLVPRPAQELLVACFPEQLPHPTMEEFVHMQHAVCGAALRSLAGGWLTSHRLHVSTVWHRCLLGRELAGRGPTGNEISHFWRCPLRWHLVALPRDLVLESPVARLGLGSQFIFEGEHVFNTAMWQSAAAPNLFHTVMEQLSYGLCANVNYDFSLQQLNATRLRPAR